MSRDITPKELYALDKHFNGSLRTAKLIDENGKDIFEANKMLQEVYPNLGFLFSNLPLVIQAAEAEKLDKIKFDNFLKTIEDQLSEYIESGNGNKNSSLILWYEGVLVPGYYMQFNDEAFAKWLITEFKNN